MPRPVQEAFLSSVLRMVHGVWGNASPCPIGCIHPGFSTRNPQSAIYA